MTAENWVNEIGDVRFTDEVTAFVARTHEHIQEMPFFVYLALSAPHSPHPAPEFAACRS